MTTTQVLMTKDQAKAKMLEALKAKRVCSGTYFNKGANKRCAIGWLMPEDMARRIQTRQGAYLFARDLVIQGFIVIEDMSAHDAARWLRRVQQVVDNCITDPSLIRGAIEEG